MPRVKWKGCEWDAETIYTPDGSRPIYYEIRGYPTEPGHSTEPKWVPLSEAELALPALSIDDVSGFEPGTLTFTVTLSEESTDTITVQYATADGTATAGEDYTAASGTLTFAPSDLTKPILITVLDDIATEGDETFTVTLTTPINATIAQSTGTGTIGANDPGST